MKYEGYYDFEIKEIIRILEEDFVPLRIKFDKSLLDFTVLGNSIQLFHNVLNYIICHYQMNYLSDNFLGFDLFMSPKMYSILIRNLNPLHMQSEFNLIKYLRDNGKNFIKNIHVNQYMEDDRIYLLKIQPLNGIRMFIKLENIILEKIKA